MSWRTFAAGVASVLAVEFFILLGTGLTVTVSPQDVLNAIGPQMRQSIQKDLPSLQKDLLKGMDPVVRQQVRGLSQTMRLQIDGLSLRLPEKVTYPLENKLSQQMEGQMQQYVGRHVTVQKLLPCSFLRQAIQESFRQPLIIHWGPIPITVKMKSTGRPAHRKRFDS
ncbi:MAG: hypothetical protein OWS74_01815 [Firmicutes bacterium]|nr:hypothetical protein [Bacillota bacterium]